MNQGNVTHVRSPHGIVVLDDDATLPPQVRCSVRNINGLASVADGQTLDGWFLQSAPAGETWDICAIKRVVKK